MKSLRQKEKCAEGNSFDPSGIVSLSESFLKIILYVVSHQHWAVHDLQPVTTTRLLIILPVFVVKN